MAENQYHRLDGIRLSNGASNNLVGGLTDTPGTGAGNVISGNRERGIRVETGSFNSIVGNIVGLNAAGTAPLGNSFQGVEIKPGVGNTIGGATPADRNIISANGFGGVQIRGTDAGGNFILGNFIQPVVVMAQRGPSNITLAYS